MMESDRTLSVSSNGLIDAEMFDFNLSVSPESQKGGNVTQDEDALVGNFERNDDDDDDEVYLGPVSFKEQCVATRVELVKQKEQNPLESLLTAEQYVELFKEANAVALKLGEEHEKNKSVKPPPQIAPPVLVDEDQVLNLSVELDIAVSTYPEREHKHGGGLETEGLSVIERYKKLTKKTVRSPRRGTYVINKKDTQLAMVGKTSSEGPTRPSKLRSGIAMQRRKPEKLTIVEQAKPTKLTGSTGMFQPMARTRHFSSSELLDRNRDLLNSSSSSCGSNCSVSSLPCAPKSNPSQRPRLSKLRPPKVKQDATGNRRSLVMQQHTKDNQSADVQQRKIPSSKPSLLRPSGLTGRSSGLARPKPSSATQKVSPIQKRKSQPMKAMLTMEKAAKPKDGLGQSENGKRPSLRRPSTPCTPRGQEKTSLPRKRILSLTSGSSMTPASTPCTPKGQDKPLLPRKRILSSASSCSTAGVSRSSCSELDSSVGTPARSRRRSCLPTPSKGSPASMKRKSTSSTDQGITMEPLSSVRRYPSSQLDGSPPAKKAAILRAVQSNILEFNSPSINVSTPDLKPVKITELKVADEPSTSPAIGTLINFNELPTKSVQNPFLKDLFKTKEVKENLIDF